MSIQNDLVNRKRNHIFGFLTQCLLKPQNVLHYLSEVLKNIKRSNFYKEIVGSNIKREIDKHVEQNLKTKTYVRSKWNTQWEYFSPNWICLIFKYAISKIKVFHTNSSDKYY